MRGARCAAYPYGEHGRNPQTLTDAPTEKETVEKPKSRVGDGTPGPGRPKGIPNKLTQSAKAAFQAAFEALDGVEGLVKWAKQDDDHMGEFYKMYARLIPVDLKVDAPQLEGVTDILGSAREILFALQLASRQQEQSQPVTH